MKLSQLQALAESNNNYANDLLTHQGATHVYKPTLHVEVLPADFEQMTQEQEPDKTWACAGYGPTVTHRFAMWKGSSAPVTASTRFDCTKE